MQNALATYEKTLLSANSRFDQYLQGNTDILSLEEKYGYQRFKDYGCIACHQGVNIGGNMFQKFGVMGDYFAARGNPIDATWGASWSPATNRTATCSRCPACAMSQ